MSLQEDVYTILANYDTTVTSSSPPTTGFNRVAAADPNRINIRFGTGSPLQITAGEGIRIGIVQNGVLVPTAILCGDHPDVSYSIQADGPIVQGEWYALGVSGPFPLTVMSTTKIR